MKTKRMFSILVLAAVLALSACTGAVDQPAEPPAEEPAANMPNPASGYCEEQGGTVEIRSDADGNQYGVCVFDDGSECDEWAFYRGECKPGDAQAGLPNPASVFCEEHDGELEIRTASDGGQHGVCMFEDGSECEEWDYFRGECQPGDFEEVELPPAE